MTFGDYIAGKRLAAKITLREMAKRLDVSAPYLSDVEKGRRKPLSMEKMEIYSAVVGLTEEEKKEMLDLAGQDRDQVAPDLPPYIMMNDYVSYALREARDRGADEDDWLKFVEELKRKHPKG